MYFRNSGMDWNLDLQTVLIVAIVIYLYFNFIQKPLIEEANRSGMVPLGKVAQLIPLTVSRSRVVDRPKTRYVRLEFTDGKPHILNINEIQAFNTEGVNVALGKKATLGKQYGSTNDFGAQYLVDGILDSTVNGKYKLPHTDNIKDAFMEVDL